MEKREFDNINDRLDFIEFRQELLFENDDVSRLLFEYQITQNEYTAIMDLMDEYRNTLSHGGKVFSGDYEQALYSIVPHLYGNYHFCEFIAKCFYDDQRWEEVFIALYGDSPKYSYIKGRQ